MCDCPESWCEEHGTPLGAYYAGYDDGYQDVFTSISDATRDAAAQWLYHKDAPLNDAADSWNEASEVRKNIYRRSADMIAKIYNGWDREWNN